MKDNKKKTGFSLIELIVVITIISVITVIGVVSFSGANTKARDSRRKSDLEKVRIAMEVYRQQNGSYPAEDEDLLTDYLNEIPQDPKNPDVIYNLDIGASFSYALYAYMENVGSTNYTGDTSGSCGGVDYNCNYQVINP